MTIEELTEEFSRLEEEIKDTEQGCGDCVTCEGEECACDDDDRDICSYGSICESCRSFRDEFVADKDKISEQLEDKKDSIFQKFSEYAQECGHDRRAVYEALRNNARHNGHTSESVLYAEGWNADMVDSVIGIMEHVRSRHEDTDYDSLLARGMSKEGARQAI